jgi:hypothetical protein
LSTDDELFQLAINFRPFTEKDRVKRTQDTILAILDLQEFRDTIVQTLAKLESGEVLSELDADPICNMNVPSVSSLIRPHCVERHWKVRNDEANKILKNDKARLKRSRGSFPTPYKPHPRLENAKAFKELFVTLGQNPRYSWKHEEEVPTEAWYRYFESVYRSSEASELCTLPEECNERIPTEEE